MRQRTALGALIRDSRIALGLTQPEFAYLLGVHHMTVTKWEFGDLAPTPHQRAIMTLVVEDPQFRLRLAMRTAECANGRWL